MTEKQKLVLDFIYAYTKLKGLSPSYMNIARGLGLKSKSNIHRLVHELKNQGRLEMTPYQVRSLVIADASAQKISNL
jgi:SOS-response transcriptional repressor LexA